MTPKHREVMQQALEALEEIAFAGMSPSPEMIDVKEAFHARQAWRFISIAANALEPLKEALAEPVQEPVEETLWPVWNTLPTNKDVEDALRIQRLNQIISPQRKWVGLTYGEIDACFESAMFNSDVTPAKVLFYEAIEAKLKEKNT